MPRKLHDWSAIQKYRDQGHGFVECSREFGFTHTAWIKAIQRKKLQVPRSRFSDRRRKYDWTVIQEYYDAGHSFRECKVRFNFCAASWTNAVRRKEIVPRKCGMPISELLSDAKRHRNHIKKRLLSAGLLRNMCSVCGARDWRGKPLSIHLDHINGVRDDNRLENLRMLCPNCHSQTPTYGGRNTRRQRLQEAQAVP